MTERGGRVASIPAASSGGLGYIDKPFVICLIPSRQMPKYCRTFSCDIEAKQTFVFTHLIAPYSF